MKTVEENYQETFNNLKKDLADICHRLGDKNFIKQEKKSQSILVSFKEYLNLNFNEAEQAYLEKHFYVSIDKNISLVELLTKLPSLITQAKEDYFFFSSPLAQALEKILSNPNYQLKRCQGLLSQHNKSQIANSEKDESQTRLENELAELKKNVINNNEQVGNLVRQNEELLTELKKSSQQIQTLRDEKITAEQAFLDEQRKGIAKERELLEKEKELNETKRILDETRDQLNLTRAELEESQITHKTSLNVAAIIEEKNPLVNIKEKYRELYENTQLLAGNVFFTSCTFNLLEKDIDYAWKWLGTARAPAVEKLRSYICFDQIENKNPEDPEIGVVKKIIFGLCRDKDKSINSIIENAMEFEMSEKLRNIINFILNDQKHDSFSVRAWSNSEYNIFRQLYHRNYYLPKHEIAYKYFDDRYQQSKKVIEPVTQSKVFNPGT